LTQQLITRWQYRGNPKHFLDPKQAGHQADLRDKMLKVLDGGASNVEIKKDKPIS
jgi:hypothetical protein